MRIKGVHGRNDMDWPRPDFEAVKRTGVGWLKMMSNTSPAVFSELRSEVPDIKFITRLYHPSFNTSGHLSPQDFFGAMEGVVENLSGYCGLFEVHNEPNHHGRIEGWGSETEYAQNFNRWFLEVYRLLHGRFPELQFGFPGLAVGDFPHNDWEWLYVCSTAIERADFFCCHCYWQNFGENQGNHLDRAWGLRFQIYHDRVGEKDFYITEAGNSNGQDGHELKEDVMAEEIVAWFNEVNKYDYVKAACPFLLSSPDPTWDHDGFTWIRSDGSFKPVVYAVGDIK